MKKLRIVFVVALILSVILTVTLKNMDVNPTIALSVIMPLFIGSGIGLIIVSLKIIENKQVTTRPVSSKTAAIDEGKLVGGCALVGVAIWEFSTNYLTENFLLPYQQTEFLRILFSSGAFQIVIGLWGLKLIYDGLGPYLKEKLK